MLCAFSSVPLSLWNSRIHERRIALLNRVWWLIEKGLTWCQAAIWSLWSVVERRFWKFDIKLFNFVSISPCCKFIFVLLEANPIQKQIQNYFMNFTNILLTMMFWHNCSWNDKHRFDKNNIYITLPFVYIFSICRWEYVTVLSLLNYSFPYWGLCEVNKVV
jgi:hypothetical protein